MLLHMLASESRMVVHVTVRAVDSLIFVNSVIKIEAIDNPLNVGHLLLWSQLICLVNWTWNDRVTGVEVVLVNIELTKIFPWKTFLLWIGALRGVNRNRLATLGRSFREEVDSLEEVPSCHVHDSLEVLDPLLIFSCQS